MELPPALIKHHLPCSASACAQRVHIWGFLITQLALNIPLWNNRAFRAQPFRSVLLPKSHSSAELLVPGSCTYTGKGSAMPRKPGKWVCSIPQSLFGAHPAALTQHRHCQAAELCCIKPRAIPAALISLLSHPSEGVPYKTKVPVRCWGLQLHIPALLTNTHRVKKAPGVKIHH